MLNYHICRYGDKNYYKKIKEKEIQKIQANDRNEMEKQWGKK